MSNKETSKESNGSNKLSLIVGLILLALIIGYIFYCNYQPRVETSHKLEENNFESIVSDISYETESSSQSSTSTINNNIEDISTSSLS